MKKFLLVFTAIILFGLLLTGCNESKRYEEAAGLMEEGSYTEAAEIFEELDDYEDSAALAQQCRVNADYNEAQELMSSGDYKNAKSAFEALGDFKDSPDKVEYCGKMIVYVEGTKLMKSGKYTGAYEKLLSLGDFEDAPELAEKCSLYMLKIWKAVREGNVITGSVTFDNAYPSAVVAVYIEINDEQTFVGTAKQSVELGNVIAGQPYDFQIDLSGLTYLGTFFNATIYEDSGTAEVTYPSIITGDIVLNLCSGDTQLGQYSVEDISQAAG